MTTTFGNFANFIVKNFVVIWEGPTLRQGYWWQGPWYRRWATLGIPEWGAEVQPLTYAWKTLETKQSPVATLQCVPALRSGRENVAEMCTLHYVRFASLRFGNLRIKYQLDSRHIVAERPRQVFLVVYVFRFPCYHSSQNDFPRKLLILRGAGVIYCAVMCFGFGEKGSFGKGVFSEKSIF